MTIQFDTGNNITGCKGQRSPLIALIPDGLSRFSDQISRLEVHLSDEDGNKNGLKSKVQHLVTYNIAGNDKLRI